MIPWTREAYAKINWTLEVLSKRADGYHELRSWFLPLSLSDSLSATPAPNTSLKVESSPELGDLNCDANNLVLLADAAWRAAGGEAPLLAWRLEKRIPVASGLGGGSSDAAAALYLLQETANLALSPQTLALVASELGSDVPFFLTANQAELRGGRGELILATRPLPIQAFVLSWPPFSVSTAEVFAQWRGEAACSAPEVAELPVTPGDNALVAAAQLAFPQLEPFVALLREFGAFVQSGSGGAHFLACATVGEAERISSSTQAAGMQALATQTREVPQPC